jgi:hypothetical protein
MTTVWTIVVPDTGDVIEATFRQKGEVDMTVDLQDYTVVIAQEPDTTYQIYLSSTMNATIWWDNKTVNSFDVHVNAPPVAGDKFEWGIA